MSLRPENIHGYPEGVWQRFLRTPHAGTFTASTPEVSEAKVGTPAAKSVLSLQLKWQADRVADARFRAYGCPTTIAVGEWLAEQAVGKTMAELSLIKAGPIRAALEIPDDQAHCTFLGEDVIRAQFRQSQR